MSVINKMLRDLDRRNAPEMRGARHATGLLRGSVPSLSADIPDPRRPSALRWVAWGGFVLATGATLFWMDDILRQWVPETPIPKPAMVMPPPAMPIEPAASDTQSVVPAGQTAAGGTESATGAAVPASVAGTAQGAVSPQGAMPLPAAPASPGSVVAAPAAASAVAPAAAPAAASAVQARPGAAGAPTAASAGTALAAQTNPSAAAVAAAPATAVPQKPTPQAPQAPQTALAVKPGAQPATSPGVVAAPATSPLAPAAGTTVGAAPTPAAAKAPVPARPNAVAAPAAPQNPIAAGTASPPATQSGPDAAQQRQQQAGREALAQAQGLWNSGSRDAAIDVLQQAVAATERSGAASAPAHQLLVSLVRELTRMQLADGRSGAALELLTRLESQLGAEPDLWAMRANAAQRLGRHQESLQAYRTALQSRPNEQRWLLGAAVSLAALGQTANANELSEKARQQGPISRDVMTYLRQMGVQVRD